MAALASNSLNRSIQFTIALNHARIFCLQTSSSSAKIGCCCVGCPSSLISHPPIPQFLAAALEARPAGAHHVLFFLNFRRQGFFRSFTALDARIVRFPPKTSPAAPTGLLTILKVIPKSKILRPTSTTSRSIPTWPSIPPVISFSIPLAVVSKLSDSHNAPLSWALSFRVPQSPTERESREHHSSWTPSMVRSTLVR